MSDSLVEENHIASDENSSVCLETSNSDRKSILLREKMRLNRGLYIVIMIVIFVIGLVLSTIYFAKKVNSVPPITSGIGDHELTSTSSHDIKGSDSKVYEYISDSPLKDALVYVRSLEQEGFVCAKSIGNELVIMERELEGSEQSTLIEIRIGDNGYTVTLVNGNGISGVELPVVLEKAEGLDMPKNIDHQKRMNTMAKDLEHDRDMLGNLYYGSSMSSEQYIYLSQLLTNRYRCHELLLMLVYEMQSNNNKAIIPLVKESLSVVLEANELAIPGSIAGTYGEEIEVMFEAYSNAAQAMQGFLQSGGQENYNTLFLTNYNDATRCWEGIVESIQQHFN